MFKRDHRGAVLGGVALADVLAEAGVPTPAYVYDLDAIEAETRDLSAGFGAAPHLVAFAVKACSAGPVVRAVARAGAGAEVVSGAELAVALGAGVSADRVLMSGVAKQAWEIDAAIGAGDRGILAIQLESVEEVARVEARAAALGRRARVGLRVNPGVEADTHRHVATGHDDAKFGIAREDLGRVRDELSRAPHLSVVSIGGHIGSQLTETTAYLAAAEVFLGLAAAWKDSSLELVDFGGGFGVDYGLGVPVVRPRAFATAAAALVDRSPLRGLSIAVEPGRALVAAHAVLCATVVSAKRSGGRVGGDPQTPASGDRRWLLIDAGMNDLLRPALYGAWHRIEPLEGAPPTPETPSTDAPKWRVAGPVCESSDDFGAHPFAAVPERVVIRDVGAYGFTMASQYNGRAMPAEIFLQGGRVVAVSRGASADDWAKGRLAIV